MTAFEPLRVAVFGSCVTRDIFNRTFNPGYKDIFECVALANQVSLVSLMAEPVPVDPADLNGVSSLQHRELLKEFARGFLDELIETTPHYLIMDFRPDLVFGFVELDRGETITRNAWSTTKTNFYGEREVAWYRADRNTAKFMSRWCEAADEFFDWAKLHIPETRIIIHKARNVGTWIDRNGEIKEFGPWSVRMNRFWNMMDDHVMSKDGVTAIDVLLPEQRSFAAHPWGPSALHYTFDYHQRFLTRLSRIAMADLLQQQVS